MLHEVEFLKQAKGLRPLEDLSGAVSVYDQNSSTTFIYCFKIRNEKACMTPDVFGTENWKSLTRTDQRLGISLGIATEENLDSVNCKCSENYEQVKKTPNEN